jgi:hypothetical protein
MPQAKKARILCGFLAKKNPSRNTGIPEPLSERKKVSSVGDLKRMYLWQRIHAD